LPIGAFTGDAHAFRSRSGSDDEGLRFVDISSYIDLKWLCAEINFIYGKRFYSGTRIDALLSSAHHELVRINAFRPTGKILDLGSRSELAACGDASGHKAFEHERLEIGSTCVDGRSMTCRS